MCPLCFPCLSVSGLPPAAWTGTRVRGRVGGDAGIDPGRAIPGFTRAEAAESSRTIRPLPAFLGSPARLDKHGSAGKYAEVREMESKVT